MTTIKTEEGPRNAAVLITQIDEGRLHAELSESIHDTVKRLYDHAVQHGGKDAKGTVTMSLSFAVSDRGFVGVCAEVATKLPKAPPSTSHFWITPGGNLTLDNPRQQKLPLREVAPPPVAPVDMTAASPAPRDV